MSVPCVSTVVSVLRVGTVVSVPCVGTDTSTCSTDGEVSRATGGAAQPPQVLRVGSDDDPSHLEEPHASPEEPHESSEEPHECPEEPRENDRSHLEEAAEVGVSNPEEPQPQLEFSPPEDPEEPQESGFSEPDPAAFQNAKRRVCESTEALKHAVVCLLAIAKTGADQVLSPFSPSFSFFFFSLSSMLADFFLFCVVLCGGFG